MKNKFTSDAFKGMFEEGAPLYNLLVSLPMCSKEEMYINSVQCLGILWCTGDAREKADAIFQTVNPPGQSQAGIASNDKDFPIVVDTLIEIATLLTIQGAKSDNKNPQNDTVPHQVQRAHVLKYGLSDNEGDTAYMRQAMKAMRVSEDENEQLKGIIDHIFGHESKLDKE